MQRVIIEPDITFESGFDFGVYYRVYNKVPIRECRQDELGRRCPGYLLLREKIETGILGTKPSYIKPYKEYTIKCKLCGRIEHIYGNFCLGYKDRSIEVIVNA